MSEHFDPYYIWLAIPPAEQPPNHYRLLGITVFESDPTVIANAAEQRMVYLRTFQLGKNSAMSEKLLNDMAAAKICLLKRDGQYAAAVEKLGLEAEVAQGAQEDARRRQEPTAGGPSHLGQGSTTTLGLSRADEGVSMAVQGGNTHRGP